MWRWIAERMGGQTDDQIDIQNDRHSLQYKKNAKQVLKFLAPFQPWHQGFPVQGPFEGGSLRVPFL